MYICNQTDALSNACPAESGRHPQAHALAEAGGWHHQSGLGDSIVTCFRRGWQPAMDTNKQTKCCMEVLPILYSNQWTDTWYALCIHRPKLLLDVTLFYVHNYETCNSRHQLKTIKIKNHDHQLTHKTKKKRSGFLKNCMGGDYVRKKWLVTSKQWRCI